MSSGIYQIQSIIKPERIYIGCSINIPNRWHDHLKTLKQNKHCNSKLQNHYNKYGKNDLVFSILVLCDKDDLLIVEQYYIDVTNPYFNICKIAGITLGYKHTEETKKYLSKIRMGKDPWNKNKTGIYSEEMLSKMSLLRLGKKQTKQQINHASDARRKPILQYDKDNGFVKEWDSAKTAGKELGLSTGGICSALRGRRNYTGGYIWKYKK